MAEELKTGSSVASPECQQQALIEELERRKDWKSRFKFIKDTESMKLSKKPRPLDVLLFDGAMHPEGAEKTRVFLPKGKVGMMAAAGGTGKTYLNIELALSVATGQMFLGSDGFDVADRGAVALIVGEEEEEEIHRRMYLCANKMTLNETLKREAEQKIMALSLCGVPGVGLVDGNGSPTAFYKDLLTELKDKAPTGGWKLIILDPASRFMGPEAEKDNAQATRFVEALEGLLQVPGNPTVLISHHVTKAAREDGTLDMNAARGSSALTDGVRWVMTMGIPEEENETTKEVEPSKNLVVLAHAKNNYGPRVERRYLLRDEGFLKTTNQRPVKKPKGTTDKDKGSGRDWNN